MSICGPASPRCGYWANWGFFYSALQSPGFGAVGSLLRALSSSGGEYTQLQNTERRLRSTLATQTMAWTMRLLMGLGFSLLVGIAGVCGVSIRPHLVFVVCSCVCVCVCVAVPRVCSLLVGGLV